MKLKGTIEVSNLRNIVFNNKKHWMKVTPTSWSTKEGEVMSHMSMVRIIHACMADEHLHKWLSGDYLNIVRVSNR